MRRLSWILAVFLIAGLPGAWAGESRNLVWHVGDSDGGVVYAGADEGSGFLGVQLREETENPEGGARVTEVVEDSPAAKAGILQGDIIVGFDKAVIRGPVALTERIHAKHPGDKVSVTVIRDGGKRNLEVELGERSEVFVLPWGKGDEGRAYGFGYAPWLKNDEETRERIEEQKKKAMEQFDKLRHLHGLGTWWGKPLLGVQLVETTPELRSYLGGREDRGVLVSKVLAGMPAERAGLAVGDLIVAVDGESIESPADLVEALEDKEGETFPIDIIRDHKPRTVEVTIPKPEEDEPTGPRA